MPVFAARTGRIDTENAFKLGPWVKAVEADGQGRVIPCNLGEPDFPVPRHVIDEVKHRLDLDDTHYNDPQGILPLREAVAAQLRRTRGIDATAERVVVFPGAKPPIGLCQQVYCDEGDEVVYPSPGFPIYESFTGFVGAVAKPLHLDESRGFACLPEALEALITPRTHLIYLNFPANPTGGVATRTELLALADVILRRAPPECRVYADEVYEHIVFDGARHESIAALPGMAERTIVVSGVSKGWCWTGGRIGWALFPTAAEAQVFKNLNINFFSCLPPYNQHGARVALDSPLSEPVQAEMVAAFQHRRDVVVQGLNAIAGVSCRKPKGAFYVFPNVGEACESMGAVEAWQRLPPDVRTRTAPSTLLQRFLLFRYRVATMDRRSFGRIGSEGRHYLRISIATALPDLEVAVERLAKAVRDPDGLRAFVQEGKYLT